MKIMSIKLYKVCIPKPNIIGTARVHNAFEGFLRKDSIRDSEIEF
jgi:hypothetical protein